MANRPWGAEEQVEVIFEEGDYSNRRYRYLLKCTWDDQLEIVTFIMLNPSTADSDGCDPTLSRCLSFAKNWGYGGFNIVNLFAHISTDPNKLKDVKNPIGEKNDFYILESAKNSARVVFAWGEKHSNLHNRNRQIIELLKKYNPHCIKKTKKGNHPRHPLYLKSNLTPIIY